MGVTAYEPNRVRLTDDLWNAKDREAALRRRVAAALRRHRAFSSFVQLAERFGGRVPLPDYARELPSAFPAVEIAAKTWLSYARAFVLWFEYAGLARTVGQAAVPIIEGEEALGISMYGFRPPVRAKGVFPQQPPGPSVDLLRRLSAGELFYAKLSRRESAALRELVSLGAVEFDSNGSIGLADPDLLKGGQLDASRLELLLEKKRGCLDALRLLRQVPSASPQVIGRVIRDAYEAEWSAGN